MEPDLMKDTVYFTRLVRGASPKPDNAHEGKILQAVRDSGGLAIVAVDDEEGLRSLMELEYFRTDGPDVLKLPDIGVAELANLSLNEMRKRGYKLLQTTEEEKQIARMAESGSGRGSSSFNVSSSTVRHVGSVVDPERQLMEYIVKNNFDAEMMRDSNAYLARDMMERAITKKNERLHRLGLSAAGRLFLKPSDFGIELLTKDQIERNRQSVEFKLSQMVGWGSSELENSPLWFFTQAKRMVELAERNESSSSSGGGGSGGGRAREC